MRTSNDKDMTRISMLKRNIQLVVAVCALVALTAVAAVAQVGDEPDLPGEGIAPVTAVEPAAKSAASLLARSREQGDALPSDLAERMNEHGRFGVNPGLSRRAIAGLSSSVYVLPGRGYVCSALTVGDGANMGCAETEDLAAGEAGASTVLLPGGAIAVYGIVPDGVDSVTVETDQPGSGAAKVVSNAFLHVVPRGTKLSQVRYSGPSGEVAYPIYDPSAP
jgi:hypothetical protein